MPEIPKVRFSCGNSNIRDLLQILALLRENITIHPTRRKDALGILLSHVCYQCSAPARPPLSFKTSDHEIMQNGIICLNLVEIT
jgi:hypothetical protein